MQQLPPDFSWVFWNNRELCWRERGQPLQMIADDVHVGWLLKRGRDITADPGERAATADGC